MAVVSAPMFWRIHVLRNSSSGRPLLPPVAGEPVAVAPPSEVADNACGGGGESGVTATSDALAALDGVDLVAIAVPSHTLRDNLAEWVAAGAVGSDVTLVSLMKGI